MCHPMCVVHGWAAISVGAGAGAVLGAARIPLAAPTPHLLAIRTRDSQQDNAPGGSAALDRPDRPRQNPTPAASIRPALHLPSFQAWGAAHVLDFLLSDPLLSTLVDPTRLMSMGHSRGGKTALWPVPRGVRASL